MVTTFAAATRSRRSTLVRCGLLAAIGLLGAGVPTLAAAFEQNVPVLMYHRITKAPADADLPELWVAPQRLKAQMAALKASGWRTITAEELARAMRAGQAVGRKRFVITIDDGARDGYTRAAPILEGFDYRATYCLTPGRINLPWQLSARQIVRLMAAGHEIANHTLTHADLPAIGSAQRRRQVRHAHLIIRELGGDPVTFCYPYGHHSRAVRRVVSNAGYLIAFTTAYGARQSSATPLRAPRIRVNGSDRPETLLARMQPFARPNATR